MKISVDGVELFTITEAQKKVFQYDMHRDTYEQELKDLLSHIIENKFERCFDRMKKEWLPKLIKEGATTIPAKKEKFAEYIFNHSDYKSRDQREKENEKNTRSDMVKLRKEFNENIG